MSLYEDTDIARHETGQALYISSMLNQESLFFFFLNISHFILGFCVLKPREYWLIQDHQYFDDD